MDKQMKHVCKKVDAIMEAISKVIPEGYTPQQVGAIFNLYMSLYEQV